MTAGGALRAAILLLAPTLAAATPVHIPPVRDGAGSLVEAYADVRLILPSGAPAIGLISPGLVTQYSSAAVPAEGLIVTLTPQSTISRQDAAATLYLVKVRAQGVTTDYRITVPDAVETQRLMDLVGATVGGAP